eukprot:2507555-Rhodomonas_salina.1
MKDVEDTIASCGLSGDATLKQESSTRFSCQVTPDAEVLLEWANCVAAAWWSVWIEEKPIYHTTNYYSNLVAQSGGMLQTPIWDAGLTGEGEVIGIADTGLDWDGCFFTDSVSEPRENVSFCIGTEPLFLSVGCLFSVAHNRSCSLSSVSRSLSPLFLPLLSLPSSLSCPVSPPSFLFLPLSEGSRAGDGAIADCVNTNHRKVVSYRTMMAVVDGDSGDGDYWHEGNQGHGTHVRLSLPVSVALKERSVVLLLFAPLFPGPAPLPAHRPQTHQSETHLLPPRSSVQNLRNNVV